MINHLTAQLRLEILNAAIAQEQLDRNDRKRVKTAIVAQAIRNWSRTDLIQSAFADNVRFADDEVTWKS